MVLKNQIKRILTGLTIPQEYICLNSKELQFPLSVFLSIEKGKLKLDVTKSHLFLGYKPLILAVPFKVNDQGYQVVKNQKQISLRLENVEPVKPTILARLVLKKIGEKFLGEEAIIFYEGVHGEHAY